VGSSSSSWFVGTLTNGEARTVSLDLAPLFDDAHASVAAHGPSHPPLPGALAAASAASDAAQGYVLEVWADHPSEPLTRTAEVRYFYLPLATVRSLLSATPVADSELPVSLQPFGAVRMLSSLHMEAQMAPAGGHCLHIMPLQAFIDTHQTAADGRGK